MPLDQSQVGKSGSAVLNHQAAREISVLQRDVRAPFVELTFETQRDDQVRQNLSESNSHKIHFSKVQLQQFFEELEKVQIKLDELSWLIINKHINGERRKVERSQARDKVNRNAAQRVRKRLPKLLHQVQEAR